MNLCTKYCCDSLNKQSSGVQEWINPFYSDSYGKNSFGLRTFRVMNDLQEWIKFVNRGSTVYDSGLLGSNSCVSGVMVPRFSKALSTNPAMLYHPTRPEFSTTLLWKPHYTVGWGGICMVILSGSCMYEYFTAKCWFSVTPYLPHFVAVYQGNFSLQTFVGCVRVAL
jgi:hypothetical protein